MEKIFEGGNYQTPKKSWFEFEEIIRGFSEKRLGRSFLKSINGAEWEMGSFARAR